MKILKIFFITFCLIFLSGCFQTTSLLGPGVTVATSGNVFQAGLQYGANTALRNETGKDVLSHIKEKANQISMTKADLIEVVIRSTRHIITTSLTTLGGFLPLIFANIFFRPLAWGMSIGVLGATMTALLYIPAMFILLKKIKT